MKNKMLIMLTLGMMLTLFVSGACAKGLGTDLVSNYSNMERLAPTEKADGLEGARLETLWIFDATFDNTTGDNAGWTVYDRSGTLGQVNYWHLDTIRTLPAYIGTYAWWCGTNNVCWRQPRGYGNDWLQILERAFPEVNAQGDVTSLSLIWDQRYAMERNYDYGFVDVSTNSGSTWTTLKSFTNGGYQGYGIPKRWVVTDVNSHVTVDMSAYELMPNLKLRFRFDSDLAASSQDQPDNAQHSLRDGAWEIDNITWKKDGTTVFWTDDGEAGNESVWQHVDSSAHGQTGVTFFRGLYGVDFTTGRDFTCLSRTGWMMASCKSVPPSEMVDGEYTWLMSPPIDISGAAKLVGHWDFWWDGPRETNDIFNLDLASNDIKQCVQEPGGFIDEDPGWWYGDPGWRVRFDNWDAFAGNDWLAIRWDVRNDVDSGIHWAGMLMNRQRVGVPSGDAGTVWSLDTWNGFHDWFVKDIAKALVDTALVQIKDDQGVASAYVVASNNDGATWQQHAMLPPVDGDWWRVPALSAEIAAGKVIRYYFTATDAIGNTSVLPSNAPTGYYEMTILPIEGSTTSPAILLVDKHGRNTPGESRYFDVYHSSRYYYREMLEILGYKYDRYDVEVPSGSTDQSNGPDTAAMKYYDTQIWFTNEFNAYTIKPVDQAALVSWLNMSGSGKERNLLLTGNDIGFELMDPTTDKDTLAFYETWLASQYLANEVGSVLVDSLPTLQDRAGGYNFMTYGDKKCILRGGCPVLNEFDVVDKYAGIPGNEVVADYKKVDTSTRPAGVAYTHATMGYQTVNLGFGMEFMMDSMLPGGYYKTGIADRVDLMRNIMLFFGKNPTGTPTGIVDGGYKNMLSLAYPNPFNPVTKIAYSVKEAGPVTIEVYNVAGKVVRTLLDTKMDAGASGYVTWDGMANGGEKCASGVYFYRLNAPGFTETQKMIMLK